MLDERMNIVYLFSLLFILSGFLFYFIFNRIYMSDEDNRISRMRTDITSDIFKFSVSAFRNKGKREYQQDTLIFSDWNDETLVRKKGLLAMVADGMGGLQNGDEISYITADTVKTDYREKNTDEPQQFLIDCTNDAELAVDKYIDEQDISGGSTLAIILIKNNALYYSSVGDSYILLIRNGKVIQLNKHHTFRSILQKRVDAGKISQSEADSNPMKSGLTSFIGIGEELQIDYSDDPVILEKNDVIMVCSDGVINATGQDTIGRLITNGSFEEVGSRIERAVMLKNLRNQDNFTAVIIRCDEIIE